MYYHVIVETTEKNKKGDYERCYEFDCTDLDEIIELIVRPYTKDERIYISGRHITSQCIRSLKVKSSEDMLDNIRVIAQSNVARGIPIFHTRITIVNSDKYVNDITKSVIKSVGDILKPNKEVQLNTLLNSNDIFIVHGRDELAKISVARFIEKMDFSAIILHEQASAGQTIIEKIEEHTNVGFAIVLYTPCDVGGISSDNELKARARQNVVFEHGYLIGKLGRQKVCALVKDEIEIPNDISGVVYIPFDDGGAWHLALAKEMRRAGLTVDMNKVI